MSDRLSKITTRTGDGGMTGLGDNSRVPKDDLRIHAMGEVDELNSQIGLLLCEALPAALREDFISVQHDLFDLGGELCIPGYTVVTGAHVARLDEWIGRYNSDLPPLKEFVLPGGSRAAALAHVCRTVCRRAERAIVGLNRNAEQHASALQYINRLSDLLFVSARILNRHSGQPDVLWEKHRTKKDGGTAS